MKETAVALVTAIIGLAIVAVIVSRNAATTDVLSAAGGALSTVIRAATSPLGSAQGASPMNGNQLGVGSGIWGNGS